MKIRHFLTIGVMGATALCALAGDPSGEPYITFTSHVANPDVWLKSSVYEDLVYFQVDDNKIDTLMITKGINELQNFKLPNANPQGSVIKIWASNKMWFINMDDLKADNISFGKDGKRGLKELRCQGNWLSDFNFTKDLLSLDYLVAGGNPKIKNAVIESATLRRLDLGASLYSMPELESLSINTPNLIELALSKSKITEIEGLDKCLSLYKITLTSNSNMSKVSLPKSEKLEMIQIIGSPMLTNITVRDYPLLRICNLNSNGLSSIDVANVPSVYHLNLSNNLFEEMNMNMPTGGQGGITFTLNGNPIKKMNLDMPYVTEFVYQACIEMDTLDLKGLPRLRRCNVQGGFLKYVDFNKQALDTCLVDVHLNDNRMAMDAFFGICPKMNPALNYYAPQENPQIPEEAEAGVVIDLSHWAVGKNYDGTTVQSEFKWITLFDEELVAGKDYIVKSPGVFEFNKAIEDKFRCFITNSAYPRFELWKDSEGRTYDWRIMTNYITVTGTPGSVNGIDSTDSAPAVYYNLQGIRVINPIHGQVYIVKTDGKSRKIVY